MGQRIKTFLDGTFLEYDKGKFDDWCVYYTNKNGVRKPPRDIDYFKQLKDYAEEYGADKVYEDYVEVYNLTGVQVEEKVLNEISQISQSYGADALEMDVILSVLYMAMIAEERKENTRLGKRIKRVGIHKLLKENNTVPEAANFMRGMGWREIDALCKERGF